VAPANNTPVMIGSSVLAVADGTEGEARRGPRLLDRTTPGSDASHGDVVVSLTASPQLERDLGYFPERGCRPPSRDSEPHPDPASPEACSKMQLHSVSGRASDKRRVCFHKHGQSINSLSTDGVVAADTQHSKDQSFGAALCAATQPWRAAVSEGERTIALSTLTLPSEEEDGGPQDHTGTLIGALTDRWCEGARSSHAPSTRRPASVLLLASVSRPAASCTHP